MIAVERPPAAEPNTAPLAPLRPRPRRRLWSSRLSASLLVLTLTASLGGGGLFDLGSAYSLQARAEALQARWSYMLDNGIPGADLAPLIWQWRQSQTSRLMGAGAMFWLPGGADSVARAGVYANLAPLERMARAELLTRTLLGLQQSLQGRIAAATLAQQGFQRTSDEISLASLYGLDIASWQARVAANKDKFGKALT